MPAVFSCHPILEVPVGANEPPQHDLDQWNLWYDDKLTMNLSQSRRPNVRVRRPLKYLKHRGPRPIAASSPTFFWDILNSPVEVRQTISSTMRSISQNPERYPNQHNLQLERKSNKDHSNHKTNRKVETPYPQSTSRLLRSRKLHLSALNVSHLSSSPSSTTTPHSRFRVMNGDLNDPFNVNDIFQAKIAGMARLSLFTPQANTSYFSDGTTSAPNSSRLSHTISDTSHSSFLPISSIEMKRKKRISDGTLVLPNHKSNAYQHTRSFSDFGLSVSSIIALKNFSG